MSLIRVWTDIGGPKNVALLAKIIKEHSDGTYSIQYFSPTEDRDHGRVIYRYEDETYIIDDDSVTEYLNTDDESVAGFKEIQSGGWIREDSDDDDEYIPSDNDEDGEDDHDEEGDDEEYQDDDEGYESYYDED